MAFTPVANKPQTDLLMDHFKVTRTISALEAAGLYRIRSLHRRIMDLEAKGHRFSRQMRKDPTGQRYMRYTYLGRGGAVAQAVAA